MSKACLYRAVQQGAVMAHVLRGYGQAREGAYFKHEQEADLQRHRTRLVKEGRLSEEEAEQANAAHRQRQQASLEECAQQFEVLGEIHAQQARVVDPQAARLVMDPETGAVVVVLCGL